MIGFQAHSQKVDSCIVFSYQSESCENYGRQLKKIFDKAESCFYAGEYERAMKLYERLLAFKPKDEYVWMQFERTKVYVERRL